MNTWESLRRFRWRELAKGERERKIERETMIYPAWVEGWPLVSRNYHTTAD